MSQMLHTADVLIRSLTLSTAEEHPLPSREDVSADVGAMYRMYDLQKIVRFFGQRHWENETIDEGSTPHLRLETVAAHSFQVANAARLLAPHFPWLNATRAIDLALLHDQPEVIVGDKDPVGTGGQGLETHAFNSTKKQEKQQEERVALVRLANEVRPSMREQYRSLLEECLDEVSDESRFVKAVDKLQALAFVRLKKGGRLTPEHTAFTLRYSKLGAKSFPLLQRHFVCVMSDLLDDVRKLKETEFERFCSLTQEVLDNHVST